MINDTVKLKWKGEEYECPVTMGLIKRMERSGVNILDTTIKIDSGGIPPVSLVAELYAWLLREAGCDVTEEDIYISIMENPADSAGLVQSARFALSAFFPKIETAERPQKSKGAKKK